MIVIAMGFFLDWRKIRLIFCVEDEKSIRDLIVYALKAQGFEAVGFENGEEMLMQIENYNPELFLLDIMLPGIDGIEIMKSIRENPKTESIPVIMLTAKSDEFDKIHGLDSGADDYITKPFSVLELIARVKAAIRRSKRKSDRISDRLELIKIDNLTMDVSSREVKVNGQTIDLTFKEFELLKMLIENKGTFLFISRLLDSSFERVEAVAKRMNVKTIDNSSSFDEDEEKYDEEIRPLINVIKSQNQEISFHIKMLKDKIIEMNEILNNMKEGLIILDDSDRIVSTNESAMKLLKIGELKAVEGRKILDVFYDEKMEKMLCGEHRISIINTESDIYLKMYISSVNDSEGINRGKIIFIEDVSKTYLDEKYRREFSTNVSHELKTPLTSINGYAEMIYLGLASEEDIKSFSKIIYNQGNRLLNMIDDIIKLSKMDEDYKPYKEKTKVNLNETIDRIVDMLIPQANDKKVNIEYSFDEVIVIDGMKILIDEIMQNILSNAIKYNVVGGSINIEMTRKEKMVEISVKDTGVGIDKEDLSRIFERFYKVDKARTKKDSSSTGLGLAIVKHASEMMGAKVHVDSEKNVGTKVVIDIPIE